MNNDNSLLDKNILANTAISKMLEKQTDKQGGWMAKDIAQSLDMIKNGEIPSLSGAAGNLYFMPEKSSIIQYSTYSYWQLSDKSFVNLAYYSRDDASHSSSAVASWEWDKKVIQDFDDKHVDIKYPELKDKWAVIIAASTGWKNYRHQADALAFYNLLKKNGYKDENIITIMEEIGRASCRERVLRLV